MRLICPHCQQSVTLPETAAGMPTPCPACGQSITPPALTGAAIDAAPEPVAPPPPPPPAPASRERERPEIVAQTPVAYAPGSPKLAAPWFHLTLRREVAHWLAPGALVVAFLLTFFTWLAVAPNGTRIYTQNGWQAAFGNLTPDFVGDRVMQAEAELKAHLGVNVWLVFYLILLIPSAAIAVADRVLARNPAIVPDVFRTIWPHRQTVVAGLCAALLLLLIVPLLTGFGLESAAVAAATAGGPTAPATPEPTTAEKAERDLRRDMKIACYGLERTVWLKLAVLAQVIAVVGIGMAWWLDRHPNAPDPRLEIYC
jgi:hypothetical protein